MERRNVGRELLGNTAVTFQTKLAHLAALEHLRIRRAVRCVASRAAFNFERRVFKDKRTLFIRVAFNAAGICAERQFGLFLLKAAVRIMTIAAFHRSFQYFVVKRLGKLRLRFGVTAYAELLLVGFQHRDGRILARCSAEKCY